MPSNFPVVQRINPNLLTHLPPLSFQTKTCHIQLGLGARSQDSGFLELGSAGFSSMERLVQ